MLEEITQKFKLFYSENPKIKTKREALGLKLPQGYLLYGPPGTGKSFFVKYIAHQLGALYYQVNVADFLNCYVGVSEKHVKKIFQESKEKSVGQKTVLLFEEVDSFATKRNSDMKRHERTLLNTFLTQLDSLGKYENLIIFATTNCEEDLDPAFKRTGRFDKHIKFEYPTKENRKQKIINSLNKATKEDNDCDNLVNYILENTSDYTYSEVEDVITTAKQNLLLDQNNDNPVLTEKYFDFSKN